MKSSLDQTEREDHHRAIGQQLMVYKDDSEVAKGDLLSNRLFLEQDFFSMSVYLPLPIFTLLCSLDSCYAV